MYPKALVIALLVAWQLPSSGARQRSTASVTLETSACNYRYLTEVRLALVNRTDKPIYLPPGYPGPAAFPERWDAKRREWTGFAKPIDCATVAELKEIQVAPGGRYEPWLYVETAASEPGRWRAVLRYRESPWLASGAKAPVLTVISAEFRIGA